MRLRYTILAATIAVATRAPMLALRRGIGRLLRNVFVVAAVAMLWIVSTVPSGLRVGHLLMFAGPGIVLAIAGSWTAHAFVPEAWSWEDGLRASATGATVFPPVVAFVVAWSGTIDPSMMVVVFVLASWCALAAGLFGAFTVVILRRRTARRGPRIARLELLQ